MAVTRVVPTEKRVLSAAPSIRESTQESFRGQELGQYTIQLARSALDLRSERKSLATNYGFEDSQIRQIQNCFDALDENGTGSLNFNELLTLLKMVFPDLPPDDINNEAEQIFMEIDNDMDHEVTLEELLRYLSGEGGFTAEMGGAVIIGPYPTTWRSMVYALLEQSTAERYTSPWVQRGSTLVNIIIQATILTSVCVMVAESMPQMTRHDGTTGNDATKTVETVCIALFTLELVMRVLSTPRLKSLCTSTLTWIDFFSILPFYLMLTGIIKEGSQAQSLMVLRLVRLVRLTRVLRVLKLGRYSAGIQLMVVALKRSKAALTWLCVMVLMCTVLFASLIFYLEKDDAVFDPSQGAHGKWMRLNTSHYEDAGKPVMMQSIPDSMWWAIVTLTTVGYGDLYPVTEGGKAVGGLCMLAGLLVMAYPVTILCNNFQDAHTMYQDKKKRLQRRQGIAHKALGMSSQIRPTFANPLSPSENLQKEESIIAATNFDPIDDTHTLHTTTRSAKKKSDCSEYFHTEAIREILLRLESRVTAQGQALEDLAQKVERVEQAVLHAKVPHHGDPYSSAGRSTDEGHLPP